MMGRGALLSMLLLVGCGAPVQGRIELPTPEKLRFALSKVSDLRAGAELFPEDGAAVPEVALERSADGRSFSGFLATGPGRYTVEVIFRGVPEGAGAARFLGRWTSDLVTVVAGSAAGAQFSRPLDVIGKAQDGGDTDGDGVGTLDELLLGTNEALADSDGDGVNDGQDCRPADAARTYPIAGGGSFADCDGDGVRRRDPPFGDAGDDCNDEAPQVHPGASDDCADAVDSDCNPDTCPLVDQHPPEISALSAGPIGCARGVSAHITDERTVSFASVSYVNDPLAGGTQRIHAMSDSDGDGTWTTPAVSQIAFGLASGRHAVRLSASDDQGNSATLDGEVELAFDAPLVTRLDPPVLGALSGPVDVQVEASAAHGVAYVALEVRSRNELGGYEAGTAQELARFTTGSGTYRLDPALFGSADLLLYAVVEDRIGNRLAPTANSYLSVGGSDVAADWACGGAPVVPARALSTGTTPFRPARMRELFARSMAAAQAVSSDLVLVQVNGSEVHDDGRVQLDSSTDYIGRWLFGFYNPVQGTWTAVTWLTPAHNRPSPLVEPDAGNLSLTEPIANPAALADSDQVVSAFFSTAMCPASFPLNALGQLIYSHSDGNDNVLVSGGGKSWMARADLSSVVFGCN